MQESAIAWTDQTWNPVHGCSKVSEGCRNCYAAKISRQYDHTTKPWTNEYTRENVTEHPEKLEEPYTLDEPSRIFVNSMSDLFHSVVTDEFIHAVFGVMRNCPHHIFQILTKRPGRAAHMALDWPPNVWMGTSVEDHRVADRLDLLRACDAETLFVSFEPLIGSVGNIDLSGYDWAIVGGESGLNYREMDHDWAGEILEACRRDDVAFFFKQSAARHPERNPYLTLANPETGLHEQRKIQEMPAIAPAVQKAREHYEPTPDPST